MNSGRTSFVLVVVAIAFSGLLANTASAGRPVILRGVVTDPEGNPLQGATVTAVAKGTDGQRATTQSNKKGTFGLRLPDHELVYTVTVGMEGCGDAIAEVRPNPENMPTLTVTLTPGVQAASQPPAAPPVGTSEPGSAEPAPDISEARAAAAAVYNEGVAALEAEDYSTALDRFKKAAEIDPEFAKAFNAIVIVAVELEDDMTAAAAAEELLRLQPDNYDALWTAYFSELMIKDFERAIPAARRLAVAKPEVVTDQMAQHARILFEEKEFAGCRALLEIIIGAASDFAPAYLQLGLSCNMLNDRPCATEALERFLELAPDDAEAATAQALLEYLHETN